MAPKPPIARHAPGNPGRSSVSRLLQIGGLDMAPTQPSIARHAPAQPGRSSVSRVSGRAA
jgi:hypothetical protein